MRFIHTADWHLCDRLGRIDRTADLQARVARVAELCQTEQADVLLIAGDLFSEQASVEDMTGALDQVRTVFRPFFARGGTIVAITGNHDRDVRVNMVRTGMRLAAPQAGSTLEAGRMYLLNGRARAQVRHPDGTTVQMVLVPYPFPSRYELLASEYRSKEEENRLLHHKVAEWIRQLPADARFDTRLPTILLAHLHVRGAGTHTLYKLTERDDVLFDLADLNPMWTYVALGHIHQPQCLSGTTNVRYPGSLDRLDFGEAHAAHELVRFDVVQGTLTNVLTLPIPTTPFYTVHLTDPEAELPGLPAKYPEHATAITRLRVQPPTGNVSRDEIARQLRKLFPRWYEFEWVEPQRADAAARTSVVLRQAEFGQNVRAYVEQQLQNDPDRAEVLALVHHFLTQEQQG
jgi:exonuclease SbcD